jgi:hypothetical protein
MPCYHVYFFREQCLDHISELCPIFLEEYVDRYHAIGFPPPLLCQGHEFTAMFDGPEAAIIIDGSDVIILVLYDADIFYITIFDQSEERIFLQEVL